MSNRISADPNPAKQGKSIQICYDFPEGLTSITLDLSWVPDGLQPSSVTLTAEEMCKTITIPDAAEGLIISSGDEDRGVGIEANP